MFCIFSLPKTGSTALWFQICRVYGFSKSEIGEQFGGERFNTAYGYTPAEELAKYRRLCAERPMPVIKIQSSYSPRLTQRILEDKIFKTIQLVDLDEKAWMLKVYIAQQTNFWNTYKSRNTEWSEKYRTLVIDYEWMKLYHRYYTEHLELKTDYTVYSHQLYQTPELVSQQLGLEYDADLPARIPPPVPDVEMFKDPSDFEQKWEKLQESL